MAEPIDEHFTATVAAWRPPPEPGPAGPLDATALLALFDAQAGSRHLDFAARQLRAAGRGYYTIGSAGHESNAAVAAALRPTDPALLHYRSGGFYLARAQQVADPGEALRDVLAGVVAAAADPISGGRHKVFGRHDLAIIPQTSTIASHLPRAVGTAFAVGRARKLGVPCAWPADAVVVCSFGDASANHSTATGAINAALHAAYRGLPLPLLLVCEDNGIGISVPTPAGWIEHTWAARFGPAYFPADGADPAAVFEAAAAAAGYVRRRRRPAFLHLRTVRLMGHAGSDYEPGYRSPAQITADYARDPLLGTAKALVEQHILTPKQVLERYEATRARVAAAAAEAAGSARLADAAAVTAPLRRTLDEAVAATSETADRLEPDGPPLTLAAAINRALREVLDRYPEALVFGEDVARKGGVYGVTRGLLAHAGPARVFDTLLDEQTVLGLALGAGISGLLPIPEIQYLAYLHNAVDQLRGEAASLQFFSDRRYRNPMVVRIAGYAYQRGIGGHFHNDNAVAALREIPGIVIASPARPDDAAAMLHACVRAARAAGAVCVFLEPIALYHTRDLHVEGDGGWLAAYPRRPMTRIGTARCYGDGTDLTVLTFGNGLRMSLRAAARLRRAGIGVRVLDLRWLAPLPVADMLRAARATGRVLVVDETRASGGVSEGVVTALIDHGFAGPIARVAGADTFIPLGAAAAHVLVDEARIEAAAQRLCAARRS